jgi:hypothetical protein
MHRMRDDQSARDMPALAPLAETILATDSIFHSDRTVIGLNLNIDRWLGRCVADGESPVLVVRPGSAITWVAREALRAAGGRWVIGGSPVQKGRSPIPTSRQVLLTVTVQHPASARVVLGSALEALTLALTGHVPIGWGVGEPVTEAWDPLQLTTFARRRMPRGSRLSVIGPSNCLVATVSVTRTTMGVQEDVAALVQVSEADSPVEVMNRVMNAFEATAGVATVAFGLAYLRTGRSDLAISTDPEGPLRPVALLIGPRAIRTLGTEVMAQVPLPLPIRVGRPRVPGYLWRLGDGEVDGWAQLSVLVTFLGPDRIEAVSPGLFTPDHRAIGY